MAFSLNKVMLIGNLGQDAETRFTASNLSVTSFSVATTYGYKGKDGNYVNETTWHNVVAFGLSDYYKDVLKKGKKVYVEGRLSKRDYTDKEGVKKYVTEVVADKFSGIIPLDSKGEGNSINETESSNISDSDVSGDTKSDDLPF
ncbi:MAG: single-stranded DNA-binding protein [Ignavibacteriales bacterium CG_4_9_14_3_um_filter_34_10]|nr:MAG: single-stranded DNA-binding protein [Ignavibacteriales bacterium CG_4_9_14_3_um_filter_34_10]